MTFVKRILPLVFLSFLFSCEWAETEEIKKCEAGSSVAAQSNSSGQLLLTQNKPVAQSFTVNCINGVLKTIDLKLSSATDGLLGKVKVEVYGEADNGTFSSFIDDGMIENIAYSPVSTYSVNLPYGTNLVMGQTYWIVITSQVANNVILRTSASSDYYYGAALWLTDPGWQETSSHRDAFFSVKIR